MNILVTGANGFVGKNLVAALKNIRDGKDRTRPELDVGEIFEYDLDTDPSCLTSFCEKTDFVFNFAGVNRPKSNDEFMKGNCEFASLLLEKLKKCDNKCPVVLSSSIQASLTGRYASSEYGKSKFAGETFFREYANETGVKVLIYRFPNLFGKWCKPNYNSVIATFCNNYANDLPISVNDSGTVLELVYIDDLINEMLDALSGNEHRKDDFCFVPTSYRITLGEIVEKLDAFKSQADTLIMPEISDGSFDKKLYSTYLSYLPKEKIKFPLKMNLDERGSFTELLKTTNCGQFSVNVSKPGITKGQHWHNSKWELFIVVSGHGLIRERKIGTDEILEFEVSGEKIEALHMLPGYTHSITNLSDTENLVTLMWANEQFDSKYPDTYFETVEE